MTKILKIIFLASLFCLMVLLPSCRDTEKEDILTSEEKTWLKENDGKILLGPDPNAPPLDFFDEKGEYRGLTADYVSLIEKKLNFKFKIIRADSWNELLEMGKRKEVDVICAAKWTPDRDKYLLFTETFIHIPNVIVTRKEQKGKFTIDDLKGKKVTMVKGYAVLELISKKHPWLDIEPCENDLDGLLKVSFGEIDAMIIDLTMASYLIEEENIANLRVAGNSGVVIDLGFASRKDRPILNRILDKGLSLVTEEERKEIFAKWIHLEDQPFYVSEAFWYFLSGVIASVLLIICLVLLWNKSLKKQVAIKTRELQESQHRYQSLIENLDLGLTLIDKDYKIIMTNKKQAELFKKRVEDFPGKYCYQQFEKRDAKCEECPGTVALETGKPAEKITKGVRDDGTKFDVRILAFPLFENGKPEGFIELVENITERLESEETIKKNQYYLEKSQEMGNIGTWELDILSNKLIWTDQTCRIFGLAAGSVIDYETFIKLVHPEDSDYVSREWEAALEGKDYDIEHRIVTGGKERWVREKANLTFNKEGKAVKAIGFVQDITENKRAEEERIRLQKQLNMAEKMETIGMLAGGVAHDLNNILGAIVGLPDLILEDLPEESPFREDIISIKESGERAVLVVNDLLTLARRGIRTTEVVNINPIIERYLRSSECFKLKESFPELEIETDLSEDLLNISGSSVHLLTVVMNLVMNAAEAMSDGGKITISTANIYLDRSIKGYDKIKEGDYVLMSVSDNGIGLSDKDLERIFEPFYTKKAMGRSGTGLGLSVVWGTVKDHEGYIHVDSRAGSGTVFKLYFPVSREEVSDTEERITMEKLMGNGEKILVIDDIKIQREISSKVLKKLNYSVTTVASGEEAIDYMKNNSADILVLDMIMDPGINGLETYEKILEFKPGQKAIIVSGFSETDDVKKTLALGAGSYVKKPYQIEKIGLAIQTELKK